MDNYSEKFFDRFIQNKFNLQNAFFEEIIISRRRGWYLINKVDAVVSDPARLGEQIMICIELIYGLLFKGNSKVIIQSCYSVILLTC